MNPFASPVEIGPELATVLRLGIEVFGGILLLNTLLALITGGRRR